MISSPTFHVISTELVVGSFAMAGLCFLLKTTYLFGLLKSDKLSLICDYAGHFALGFGLIATPFAILSGLSASPGEDISSPLLVNKMFLSMTAVGIAVAVLFTRLRLADQVWGTKQNGLLHGFAGMAASGIMLITASAGGKFSRGESLLDIFSLPYDTIFLMPMWISTVILLTGSVSVVTSLMALMRKSAIQH